MNRLSAAFLALLMIAGGRASGQTKVTIPAVPDAPMDNLVRVVAPSASAALACDRLGMLVFAHHPKYTEAQVTLFRLDSQTGKPGERLLIKLPKPAALAKVSTYVTGLAFHPKSPLLYVWQDIEFPKNDRRVPLPLAPADEKAMAEFDHLLIYSVEKAEPELLLSMARGERFAFSRPVGSLTVDQAGERLYVPNLANKDRPIETTFGSYVLHPDGMPVIGEPPEGKGTAQDRTAHIAAVNANKSALPQRIAPAGGFHLYGEFAVGSGIGFVPVGRDIVLTGGFHHTGIASWTPDNRQCQVQSYRLSAGYTHKLPAGHPTLPLIFISDLGSRYLYRFEHADGNLTLVPQRAELEAADLASVPVVMAKTNRIAVGGNHRIFVVGLNEKGKFKTERQQTVIGNQRIEALAYSDKFDRLYVGVEKGK